MQTSPQIFLNLAGLFYGLALVAVVFPKIRPAFFIFFTAAGLFCNTLVVGLRYHQALPMLPMYLGAVAATFWLGLFLLASLSKTFLQQFRTAAIGTSVLLFLLTLAGMLFPKDFYLPFVKSNTLLAHLFFMLGAVAKAAFLMSAIWATAGLLTRGTTQKTAFRYSWLWTVGGFGLWTVSMFSGELWSYLGWGTPVVWDDPAILTTMATWFFYIGLLHLHLTGTWTAKQRGLYAAAGAGVIGLFNIVPELGPLRWPL